MLLLLLLLVVPRVHFCAGQAAGGRQQPGSGPSAEFANTVTLGRANRRITFPSLAGPTPVADIFGQISRQISSSINPILRKAGGLPTNTEGIGKLQSSIFRGTPILQTIQIAGVFGKASSGVAEVTVLVQSSHRPASILRTTINLKPTIPSGTPISAATPFRGGVLVSVGGDLTPKIVVLRPTPSARFTVTDSLIQSAKMKLKSSIKTANKLTGAAVSLLKKFVNKVKKKTDNMKIKINIFPFTKHTTQTPPTQGTTEPPITQPPMTEPPMTEPPMTKPPMTEPPMTEPPMTEPPPTAPPPTEPPVTEPPATEPPPTEPPPTEPPPTEPPATEPPVTEPPPTEPPATEPPPTYPPPTEPPPTEPPPTEPPPTEPPPTEPPATEPPATEPPATEPPATEPPATEPPPTEPPPPPHTCPPKQYFPVTSTRFSLTTFTNQLHTIHRTESTVYVTETRLVLAPTTLRVTITRHALGTLYQAQEMCPITQFLVRTHTLLRTRYRTETEHLSVTDTVNHYITETVTLPRPTTLTVRRTSLRSLHAAATRYTTVTRHSTLTRTEVRTSTAHVQSTAVVTAQRTHRTTVTRDVLSTLPPHTVTRTLIYCPPDY